MLIHMQAYPQGRQKEGPRVPLPRYALLFQNDAQLPEGSDSTITNLLC